MRIITNAHQSRLEEAGWKEVPFVGGRDQSEGCRLLVCACLGAHTHAYIGQGSRAGYQENVWADGGKLLLRNGPCRIVDGRLP